MPTTIHSHTLRAWLDDRDEIALLDVRDGGPYSRDHIVVATSVPRTNFETHIARLLPRRSVRVVLTDDDGSTLSETGAFLEAAGYDNVHLLEQGNAGWVSAGFRLFSGSNIVSKVFGELVETKLATPHVDAATLSLWQTEGRKFHLFDVRPLAEFRTVSIPGATNCPGMETILRVPQQMDDESTPIIVNCAGRTRSIIGAQTLRESGIRNPVYALENGTMGWQLNGLATEHGRSEMLTEPFGDQLRGIQRNAADFAVRNDVRFIDHATVRTYLADTSRTTYLFDVRLAEAYSLGHLSGSVNAPGGQLIQNTDTFAAVRNSRIVLIDEHLVQSVMTAHWLSRMGWDVVVLRDAGELLTDQEDASSRSLVPIDSRVRSINADDLQNDIRAGACTVIDVGESYWYRQGRIPGSYWALRSALSSVLSEFDRTRPLIFVCSTGHLAPFAAGDALRLGFGEVAALAGGRSAWRRAGGEVEVIGDTHDDRLLTPTDDMWYPPWARAEGAHEAMAEYLSWEVGLVGRLIDEEYLRFSRDFDMSDHRGH